MEWIRGPTIGRGSTATVSLATTVPSGELFAVKSAELSRSSPLQKERLVLSKLASPHIVEYMGHDITHESGKLYYNLWAEYLPKGTLLDEIRRRGGRLGEPEIRSNTRKILRGLEYLHENGLVHGDVKGENLLMGSDGLKIADLGCARFVGTRQSSRVLSPSRAFSGVDSRETHDECGEHGMLSEHAIVSSDVFSGTPMFMAPEVARNEEQSFPSDVWSVGCTVIEMATGKGPWAESDPVSALYRIGFSSDVPEIPRQLSDSGRDFLAKCLARDPRERWAVKELLEHPFLDESKISEEFTRNSPNGVLDSGFWDSVDVWESPRNRNGSGDVDSCSCSWSPATERMKSLIEEYQSSSANQSLPDRALDEEWITVRSNNHEEEVRYVSRPTDSAPITDPASDEEELESSLREGHSHYPNNSLDTFFVFIGVDFREGSFDFRDSSNVVRVLACEEENEIADSAQLQVLHLNLKALFFFLPLQIAA
ncbi:mitogen-activated protein kinase kinase kinase 18-like [Rhodamnia argentea]|uniref:Mitogen-activated protein kinase kinase kinase 18-like n=1 Tax=Rhodamnia argentea TaxID=178133 RepID=A0A8B8NLJ0_9MYRT|nr:mitogen-activated protein kinase kinase kinase 18-like [Rhodamnia argentea]